MSQSYRNDLWDSYEQVDDGRIHKNVSLYGYKAFNNNMTCFGQLYEVGKTYTVEEEQLKMCEKGFHFCRYPCDVFHYYPTFKMFAIIKAENIVIETIDKCITNQITIIKIITREELLKEMPNEIIRIDNTHEYYKDGQRHRDNDLPAIVGSNYQAWYKNGQLHRDNDLPAYIECDHQEWFKNGLQHRDNDLPAYINVFHDKWYENGQSHCDSGIQQEWYKNGQLHRDNDLPAFIKGSHQAWFKNGQIHRDNDLPAFIKGNFQKWCKNGLLHRDNDLPAVINGDYQAWYKNGKMQYDNDLSIINCECQKMVKICDTPLTYIFL